MEPHGADAIRHQAGGGGGVQPRHGGVEVECRRRPARRPRHNAGLVRSQALPCATAASAAAAAAASPGRSSAGGGAAREALVAVDDRLTRRAGRGETTRVHARPGPQSPPAAAAPPAAAPCSAARTLRVRRHRRYGVRCTCRRTRAAGQRVCAGCQLTPVSLICLPPLRSPHLPRSEVVAEGSDSHLYSVAARSAAPVSTCAPAPPSAPGERRLCRAPCAARDETPSSGLVKSGAVRTVLSVRLDHELPTHTHALSRAGTRRAARQHRSHPGDISAPLWDGNTRTMCLSRSHNSDGRGPACVSECVCVCRLSADPCAFRWSAACRSAVVGAT